MKSINYILERKALQPVKEALKARFPRVANLARAPLHAWRARTQTRDTFRRIYKTGAWKKGESVSGEGSNLEQTVVLRNILPSLLHGIQATTMLDAPCGDHFWMKEFSLNLNYIGIDIVPEIIDQNRRKYGSPRKTFLVRDITKDSIPRADCILCRDCLDHLSFEDVFRAVENFRLSGAKYLLATTYTERTHNEDIVTGEWRPTNLQQPPFSFPAPIQLINEHCTEEGGKWADKSLGLWRIQDLPSFRIGRRGLLHRVVESLTL